MNETTKQQLVAILNKIPMFHGIEFNEAEHVLKICHPREYGAGETLCAEGTPPLEMYILLAGEMSVVREHVEITTLKPVVPVGEMGIVTGEVRTASILTKVPSRVFVIRKVELDAMIRHNIDLGFLIFKNLARTLSQRLATASAELEHLRQENAQLKQQLVEREGERG
jgi:CRP-like cAMP-binding protein